MNCRRVLLAFLLSAVVAPSLWGQEPRVGTEKKRTDALDVVSEEAVAAVAIRSVSELTKRGDAFIEKTEFKSPMRLSDGYKLVVGFLGLHKGLDEQGAAALMCFRPQLEADSLVLAVPVADFEAMAGNFKLARKDLVEGKVIDRREREGDAVFEYARYLGMRGNHLLMGGNPKFIETAAKGKTLRDILPADDRDSLARHDILLFANPQQLKDQWIGLLHNLPGDLMPDEAMAMRGLIEASGELKHAIGGLRLDEGLGASVVLRFEGAKSRAMLSKLQGTSKDSKLTPVSLAGLPAGRVLAAYAASGDGDQSSALARALVHVSLAGFVVETREFISSGHRPNVVGVFGEVWQRLEGSRTALYENENTERDGQFSLVALLDTENPRTFVAEMTSLARFINASGLALDDAAEAIDAKTIAALVADLGHDEYRVRQTASTKLGLVGKPALAALEAALAAKDAEVQFRARSIRQQIQALVAEERESLLKGDLLSRIRPNFAYFPQAETRKAVGPLHAPQVVDIVQMRLKLDEATHAAELRRLLGPDWSKLRLATIDNRVLVLLGSNTALFDQTIANVRAADKALAADARFATFRSRVPANTTLEFHLALTRSQQLVATRDLQGPAAGDSITSFGLSITPERVRFDLFSPFEEVKSVTKKLGW